MPESGRPQRLAAIAEAALVTVLWSSSYILIKIGLDAIPPLTFASLRYFLAFLALVVLRRLGPGRLSLKSVGPREWRGLIALGLILYALVPAAMFLSLDLLPAITVNFVFQAGIPVVVAILSGLWLAEPTLPLQWLGVLVTVAGIYLFFPAQPRGTEALGVVLALVTAAGVAVSNLLTRSLMRERSLPAAEVSMISMGVGSSLLLVISLIVEPFPRLSGASLLNLGWLSLINTALAFTLWNRSLRTLSALEGGVLANAQIVEVALMAWIFLGEQIVGRRLLASLVILAGVAIVQLHRLLGDGGGLRRRQARGGEGTK